MALEEVSSGDAAAQFDSTQKLLNDLAAMLINSGAMDSTNNTKDELLRTLVLKLQNVMTDRHVVNKLWVQHMQSWRTQVDTSHIFI